MNETATTSGRSGSPPRGGTVNALRVAKPILVIGVLIIVIAIPLVWYSEFRLRILALGFVNSILAAALVLSFGYMRLLVMSHATAYGLGAYAAAILIAEYDVPFEFAMLASMAAAGAGGLVLASTIPKVSGDKWALLSIAFSLAGSAVFENWGLLGGREGLAGIPTATIFGYHLATTRDFYYFSMICAVLAIGACVRIGSSHAGRAMRAIGHDTIAARTLGIDVGYYQVVGVAGSSALAGAAGGVTAVTVLFVNPTAFSLIASFAMVVWVVVGGRTSVLGAAGAAVALTYITESSRQVSEYRIGILGVVLILALLLSSGVLPFRRVLQRIRRRTHG